MATFIYLSDDPSDVSGYKKAYVNTRSPNATSTYAATTTDTVVGVLTTVVDMTLTAAGTTAQWLTAPFEEDVLIDARPIAVSLFGSESNAAANAQIAFRLNEYTTSLQSAFFTTSVGVELGTDSGENTPRINWAPGSGAGNEEAAVTSTTIDAGNRLAITPGITGVANGSNMGASRTVSMLYGAIAAVTGDTFLVLEEDIRVSQPQVGEGDIPGITSMGKSYFLDLKNTVQSGVDHGLYTSDASAQAIIDEAANEAAVS